VTDDADRAATALIAAFRTPAGSLPGRREKQAAPGVISLMPGLPMGGLPLPWSIPPPRRVSNSRPDG
jgi:hypothetical protein